MNYDNTPNKEPNSCDIYEPLQVETTYPYS